MRKPNSSVTIGIPTYEAGESLVALLRSIYEQTAFANVKEILLIVDGGTIAAEMKQNIIHPKLNIVQHNSRKGQSERINDIFKAASTPLVVLTNDDVVWKKDTLERLLACCTRTNASLVTGHVAPLPAASFFERIINTGSQLSYAISHAWNQGDNYLSANGRLIMLQRSFVQSVSIPTSLWNNDAYIYYRAKQLKKVVSHAPDAWCFFRNPSQLGEHLKQSRKFTNSRSEMQPYFSVDLKTMYAIPKTVQVVQTVKRFLKDPIHVTCYFLLHVTTRMYRRVNDQKKKMPYWETDRSTKRINVTMQQ